MAVPHLPRRSGCSWTSASGALGMRSQRYAMIVEDGIVKALNVEDAPGTAEKSGADAIAALLA